MEKEKEACRISRQEIYCKTAHTVSDYTSTKIILVRVLINRVYAESEEREKTAN